MATPSDDPRLLSSEDARRLVYELIASTGEGGISKDDIEKAWDEVHEMLTSWAAMTLWFDHELVFGWRDDTLVMRSASETD